MGWGGIGGVGGMGRGGMSGWNILIQGYAESLQHCIRPPSSVTSLYGRAQ